MNAIAHTRMVAEYEQMADDAEDVISDRATIKRLRDALTAAHAQNEALGQQFSSLSQKYRDTICELMSVQAERDALWNEKYLTPRQLAAVAA